MLTEAELRNAIDAGYRYQPVITEVLYDAAADRVVLVTPRKRLVINRKDADVFRDIPPALMAKMYVSQTGVHIDDIDLDISSAGLIEHLFPEERGWLAGSF